MVVIKKIIVFVLTLIMTIMFICVKGINDKSYKTFVNSYDIKVEFLAGEGTIIDFFGNEYKSVVVSYSKGSTIVDVLTLTKYNLSCDKEFIGWFTQEGYLWNFDEDVIRYNIKLYAKYSG